MARKKKKQNHTPTGRTPSRPNFQNIPGTLADILDKVSEGQMRDDAMAFNDPWWPADLGSPDPFDIDNYEGN